MKEFLTVLCQLLLIIGMCAGIVAVVMIAVYIGAVVASCVVWVLSFGHYWWLDAFMVM